MITVYEQNLGVLCNHKGLVTNYEEGGLQNWRGGKCGFIPTKRGRGRKSLSHVLIFGSNVLG